MSMLGCHSLSLIQLNGNMHKSLQRGAGVGGSETSLPRGQCKNDSWKGHSAGNLGPNPALGNTECHFEDRQLKLK